jgi:hypothetical protein
MAKSSRRKHPAPPKEAETPSTDAQEPELYKPPPPETAEAAEPAAKRQAGRPLGAKTGAAASNRTLFQRMEEIPADDWGSRATVHLYRLEPFTDRLRSGNVIHIMRYSEPIDEARVMADHGSGKYRAILNFRKQSGPKSDEVGRFEFEILNTMFPPNVPLGEWVDARAAAADPNEHLRGYSRHHQGRTRAVPRPGPADRKRDAEYRSFAVHRADSRIAGGGARAA